MERLATVFCGYSKCFLPWEHHEPHSSAHLDFAFITVVWTRIIIFIWRLRALLFLIIFSCVLQSICRLNPLSIDINFCSAFAKSYHMEYSTSCSTREIVRYKVKKNNGTTHNTQCEHNPLPSLCLHSTPLHPSALRSPYWHEFLILNYEIYGCCSLYNHHDAP